MLAQSVSWLWLIPFFPLLGCVINGLLALSRAHHRDGPPRPLVNLIACLAPAASFVVTVAGFLALRRLPGEERALTQTLFTWLSSGSLQVDLGFLFDPLSCAMLLFVTGIGSLIHVYSIGYMAHDRGHARYFAYLNLFMFAMILLVLGDSLPVLFIGWEGVGLCSYLLIGFWHEDPEKAKAGMKAFVVNRIGDFGFLLGMFLIFWTLERAGIGGGSGAAVGLHTAPGGLFGSGGGGAGPGLLSYAVMSRHAHLLAPVATAAGLLLFLGATGKSAQIPLFVWLPDAMAGPTPVSALIHAATMVTSGVYMLARMNFLYVLSPVALTIVAIVGVLTAAMAATIGLTQFDIKKILAYSTVSQLGYMFLGAGVGAFSAGIFHVVTHAFFKALLFLGAGSVIHALSGEQDIRKMGGLYRKIPTTARTFLVAWLAIGGIPIFAGFFSKDEILWKALSTPNPIVPWLPPVLWTVAFLAAGLTAIYMTRLVVLTFFGPSRVSPEVEHHIHESPRSMTIPLIVLAIGSTLAGLLGTPAILHLGRNRIERWLEPVLAASIHGGESASHGLALEAGAMAASVILAAACMWGAWRVYTRRLELPRRVAASLGGVYRLVRDKYRVDEAYETAVVRPLVGGSRRLLFGVIDVKIIDFLVNQVGIFTRLTGNLVAFLQTGQVQAYALVLLVGVAVMLLVGR